MNRLMRERFDLGRSLQRGAVLVVGLIFLALLTLLGVTTYSVMTQEERMAGSARDRLRAFEAAEAALRHCEALVGGPAPPTGGTWLHPKPAPDEKEVWEDEKFKWGDENSKAVEGIQGVAEPPRCLVQQGALTKSRNPSVRAELRQPLVLSYYVTARGVGSNPHTVVMLQSTFVRD